MYISQIKIQNFRCFKDTAVYFQPGINVIIGENNGGKTAILAAMGKIFDQSGRKKLDYYDIYQGIEDFTVAPKVSIQIIVSSSSNDTLEDKGLVAAWLTQLQPTWEATLTYVSFLPEDESLEFQSKLGSTPTKQHFYKVLASFLPKYVTKVYGGNPEDRQAADRDSVARFDYQYLDALRDAKSELFIGSNPLLNSMLKRVLDRKPEAEIEGDGLPSIGEKRNEFRLASSTLLENLIGRLDHGSLFQLVDHTGAGDGGKLKLDGEIGEHDFIAALKLFVARCGFEVPMSHNGLGYNNLVYISLVLAQMDMVSDSKKLGQNAILFPMLLLEEPEAHLHPSLQHKLLRYIRERIAAAGKNRQAFITTHSTHITSACSLDEIVCMTAADDEHGTAVSYPGKVFGSTPSGRKSKKYVERFLDATKSNMLFSKAVIFVEGIAEQLVIPQLAEALSTPLDMHQVALIRVDGSTFRNFLPLFGGCETPELAEFSLKKPAAFIVDADPARMSKSDPKPRRKGCWPYVLGLDTATYDYYPVSGVFSNLKNASSGVANVLVVHGTKTFEYDFALANSCLSISLTDSQKGMASFCDSPNAAHPDLEKLLDTDALAALAAMTNAEERTKAMFASYYLGSIEKLDAKGEHAFDLSIALREHIEKAKADSLPVSFAVPAHIKRAAEFACRMQASDPQVSVGATA